MAKCNEIATFRLTWPGKDEAYVCIRHAKQFKNIADAMGFHLQLLPISYPIASADQTEFPKIMHCQQEVEEKNDNSR